MANRYAALLIKAGTQPGLPRRSLLPSVLTLSAGLLTACGSAREAMEAAPAPAVLALNVEDEVGSGAVLLDVRGPTERSRDGRSALPHLWHPFGPDRWHSATSEAKTAFVSSIADVDTVRGRRLLLLCSVGVRSEAAARVLSGAGYHVANVRDGWLGNHAGPGLREVEQMMGE